MAKDGVQLSVIGYMLVRTKATIVLIWAAATAIRRREQALAVALVFFAIMLNWLIEFWLPCEARVAVNAG